VHECIRINHGKDDRTVREGIQIIAETVKEALA
jgi:alanine-alpha-ketoisovalerate/valine-pyruvate aminotransferase